MAKPKHDYDNEDFYRLIKEAALNGATDAQVAVVLELTPQRFCQMKNGTWPEWTDEENKRRSAKIREVLAQARDSTNRLLRAVYLTTILGKTKIKNKTTVVRNIRTRDGELTGEQEIQTTTAEIQHPPSLQGIATWLHHHDPEWRKGEKHQDEELPDNIEHGISIDAWIKEQIEKND